MLDLLPIIGTQESWLKLQTRRKSDIPNVMPLAVDEQAVRVMQSLRAKFPDWAVRRPANPEYNCAGLVWAARRTNIVDESAYELVLHDDGYRAIPLRDVALGDLVIYRRTDTRAITHVGLVIEFGDPGIWLDGSNAPQRSVPYVLSKMCDWGDEIIHNYFRFPRDLVDWTVEFWTERPAL